MSGLMLVALLLEGVRIGCYMRGCSIWIGSSRGSRRLIAAAFLVLWILESLLVCMFPQGRGREAMLCDLFFWLAEMPVLLVFSLGFRGGFLRHLLTAVFLPAIYWGGKWMMILALFSTIAVTEHQYALATLLAVVLLAGLEFVMEKLKKSRQELERRLLQQELQAYEKQFALIRQSQEKIRALKHDMKHHMKMLRDLTAAGDTKGALSYLADMGEFMENGEEYVSTGNDQLDSILNDLIARGKQAQIAMEWKVQIPEDLKLAAFDLNVILSNLFENAFHALRQVPEPALSLLIRYDRGILCISTRNNYSPEESRRQEGEEHGYGLKNVRRIAEKYHGNLTVARRQGEFAADVLLYLDTV